MQRKAHFNRNGGRVHGQSPASSCAEGTSFGVPFPAAGARHFLPTALHIPCCPPFLQPVPATFLKQLATDRELFWDLPVGVQRQVRLLLISGVASP